MAFKDVDEGRNFKKLTALNVGESLTGYPIAVEVSTNPKARGAINLIMNINGERVSVSTAGNVKYQAQDGRIKLGLKTMITRLADGKIAGKTASNFRVQQDSEDVLAGFDATAAATTPTATVASKPISEKLAALKA